MSEQQQQTLAQNSTLPGQDIRPPTQTIVNSGVAKSVVGEQPTLPNSGAVEEPLRKSKRLVSFEVFMKYVVYREDHVDVSKVFSKECFEEWIENRKGTPKEPEESFRKALVAHVSGKDDRKPFAPDVEFEILKRLRVSEPWPCFASSLNGANKIGERGLKKSSLGYHEGKRKRVEEYGVGSPGVGRGFHNLAPHPSNPNGMPYQYYQVPPPQMHVTPGVFPPYYPYSPHFYPPPPRYIPPPAKRQNSKLSGQIISPQQVSGREKKHDPVRFCFEQIPTKGRASNFAKLLTDFYTMEELAKLFEVIPDLFNLHISSAMNGSRNMRFQEHFFIPPEGTTFDEKKNVGQIALDIFGQVISADSIVESVIDNPFTKNIFSLFSDPVERAFSLCQLFTVLLSSAPGFTRWVLKAKSQPLVLLVKLSLGQDRSIICRLQDVSENYLHLFTQTQRS